MDRVAIFIDGRNLFYRLQVFDIDRDKAERLAATRPSNAADRIAIRVYKEWHFGPQNALVP